MAHGASAPSPSDSDRSGTTRSGSISIWWPSPVQRGHAPCGLLNEKIRGSSSGIDVPHFRHAKRSEKVRTGGQVRRPARDELHLDDAVRQRHRGLDRVGQPLAEVVAHHEPVDDHRDVVLELLVELDRRLEHPQLAVDLDPREALGAQLVEQLAVLALAAAHDGRHDHEALALLELHDLVDDLLRALAGDRRAAVEAVGLAHPRPEQPQVVVDLRDGPDRRARVARGRLLVDGDRRRQALDRVDVRLVHLPEELARVGAERLDVAALALGVDRVEGQRRLARPRQARDDDQRVPRQGQRDVLEVVLPGTRDRDRVRRRHAQSSVVGRTDVPPTG